MLFTDQGETDPVIARPIGLDRLTHTKGFWVSHQREQIVELAKNIKIGKVSPDTLTNTIADLKDFLGANLGSPAALFYELTTLLNSTSDPHLRTVIKHALADIVVSLYYAPNITYANLLADIQLLLETTNLHFINSRQGQQWLGFYRTVFSPEDFDSALERIANYANAQLLTQKISEGLSQDQVVQAQAQLVTFNQWRQDQSTQPRQVIDQDLLLSWYRPTQSRCAIYPKLRSHPGVITGLFNRSISTAMYPARFLSNHPLVTSGVIFALKAAVAYAKQAHREPDSTDITENFHAEATNFMVHDIKHDLVSNDVTQGLRRELQAEASNCESNINFPEPDHAWTVALGGGGYDRGMKVAVHENGKVVVVGRTNSFGGTHDVLLAQFDPLGALDWAKTLGGTGTEFGLNLLSKPGGQVVVIGETSSFGAGNLDVLLAQFDTEGDLQWAWAIGGNAADRGNAIALRADGSMLLTGYTRSFGAGDRDALLAQVDASGNIDWAKRIGGLADDYGYDVLITEDEGFVITGSTQSYGFGNSDVFTAKFDPQANLTWARVFGGSSADIIESIAQAGNGTLVLAGRTASVGAGGSDSLLLKLDKEGNFLWSNALGGLRADPGRGVVVMPNGKILTISQTNSYGGGIQDALLTQLDSDGRFEWAWSIGGAARTRGYGLAFKSDGSIIWVGESDGYAGARDAIIMHSTPDGQFRQFDSGSMIENVFPILTEIIPTNSSSIQFAAVDPVIEPIQLMLSSDVSGLTVSDISTALRYQPIRANTSAWADPPDAYLNYRWQYQVPEQKFLGLETQPNMQLSSKKKPDWISFDVASGTLSGTPIFAEQGEVRVRLVFESVIVPGMGLVTLQDIALTFCLRVDHSSSFIKRIGGTGSERVGEIALKQDGSVVVVGASNSYSLDGDDDLLVVQFNPSGQFEWARSFGGGGTLFPNDLKTTPDGGIVALATIEDPTASCTSSKNIVVAKFSGDGSFGWAQIICKGLGHGLAISHDGTVVVVGQILQTTSYLLATFNNQGDIIWINSLSSNNIFYLRKMVVREDAVYTVGVVKTSTDNALLIKSTLLNGDLQWAKSYGGIGNEYASGLTVKENGKILVIGSTQSFGAGGSDILLVQSDTNGNLDWATTLGGSNGESAWRVAVGPGGKAVVLGSSYSHSLGSGLFSVFDATGALVMDKLLTRESGILGFNELIVKSDGSVTMLGETQRFGARNSELLLMQVDSQGNLGFPGSNAIQPIVNAELVCAFVNLSVADVTPLFTQINDTYQVDVYTSASLVSVYNSAVEGVWFLDYFTVPSIINHPFGQVLVLDMNSLLGRGVQVVRIAQVNDAFLPSWLIYDVSNSVLSGVPTGRVRGHYFIELALEGYGQSQSLTFAINVTNTVPYLNERPVYNTTIGRFVVQLPFVDDEGDLIRPFAIDQVDGELAPTIGSIDANTGRLFGTTLSGDQGVYLFNITASDPYNQGWQLVTVNVLNADPIVQFDFTSPPPVTVGNLFSYSFPETAFVDRDGDLLSYQVQVPSFVSFNPNSRSLTGTPLANDRGDYAIVFTATDGYGGQASTTINLSVNGVPLQQMTFDSITTSQVGQYFSQMLPSGLIVDPDGDPVAYQLFEDIQHIKPAWLDFNPLTNTLSGTPNANSHQAIPVRFKVTDGRGGKVFYDLSIVIPNAAPSVGQSLDDQSLSVDQTRGLIIPNTVLSDPDGDALFYFLELVAGGSQNWVSLTGNVITLSPKSGHQGAYQFRVTGSDAQGEEASTLLNVNVLNRSPRLVYEIPDPSVAHAGQVWSFSLAADNFADDDNDPLDYDASLSSGAPLPQWITFNPIRRSFTGMPTGLDRGEITLKAWVDDRFGGQAQGLFNVSVVNSEPVPRERLFDQQASVLRGSFIFTIPEFIDPDGDQVSYSSRMRNGDPLPSWIHFDPMSRTYTVFPNQAPPGNYLISAISSDEYGKVNEESFNLAIQAAPSLDEGTSTADVLQLVLPLVAALGLLTIVVSTLAWRTRRVAKTDRRIRAWASVEHSRRPELSEVVSYAALYLHLTEIAEQLNKNQPMDTIERSLVDFSSLVSRYYAQQGVKLTPMSRLLNLGTVKTLFKYVHRNILEIRNLSAQAVDTVDAARALHFFLALVLKEHTGRRHRLSHTVKVKYFTALDALIARLPSKTRVDIHILYELRSCREAVACMTDTNTLGVLCKNSLSHILSPGGLVADLKALVFDLPSTWYVGLLVMNQRLSSAKQAITKLTELQNYAARETDWEFRYGMINILLNVITTTRNKAMLTQAIEGQQRYGQPTLLGYKHLLNDKQSCLLRWRNHWVRRQARWALNQVVDRLSQDAKRLLSGYCQQVPTGRKQRRVSVLVTPLDSQQLQAGVTDWSQPAQLAERKERALDMLNPMYRGTTLPGKRPPIQPRQVRPSG